jgi:hypothetical protein
MGERKASVSHIMPTGSLGDTKLWNSAVLLHGGCSSHKLIASRVREH